MACDTRLKPKQTVQERIAEVKAAATKLEVLMSLGKVRVKIGQNGVPFLDGWSATDRDGVTDACVLRRLGNSPTVKAALTQAETTAGRPVNRPAMAQGWHTHDAGQTWHTHRK